MRLELPPGQGKQAEILGHGPDAAPAVVEVLRQAGWFVVLVYVEHAGGAPDKRVAAGDHVARQLAGGGPVHAMVAGPGPRTPRRRSACTA